MKKAWTEESFSYDGAFHQVPPKWTKHHHEHDYAYFDKVTEQEVDDVMDWKGSDFYSGTLWNEVVSGGTTLKDAVQAVESGRHDIVLAGGVERCTSQTGLETAEMTRVFLSAADRQYEQPTGITFRACSHCSRNGTCTSVGPPNDS